MAKLEKIIKGLKQCTSERECGFEINDNPECPYSEMENGCVGQMMRDALEALKEREPRMLTLEEFMSSSGSGYVEIWFEGDPEEGLKEEKVLIECGWCRGCYVTEDGDFTSEDYIAGQYNKRYGLRVWTGRPTDEQREATPWDEQPKEGDGE